MTSKKVTVEVEVTLPVHLSDSGDEKAILEYVQEHLDTDQWTAKAEKVETTDYDDFVFRLLNNEFGVFEEGNMMPCWRMIDWLLKNECEMTKSKFLMTESSQEQSSQEQSSQETTEELKEGLKEGDLIILKVMFKDDPVVYTLDGRHLKDPDGKIVAKPNVKCEIKITDPKSFPTHKPVVLNRERFIFEEPATEEPAAEGKTKIFKKKTIIYND